MQRLHRGVAAQGLEDLVPVVALDRDRHERGDALLVDLRSQAHGVARDDARTLDFDMRFCTVPRAITASWRASRPSARIDPQQPQQLAVYFVHWLII